MRSRLRDALAQRPQRLLRGEPALLQRAQLVGEVLEARPGVGERALGVRLHGERGLQPLAHGAFLQPAELHGSVRTQRAHASRAGNLGLEDVMEHGPHGLGEVDARVRHARVHIVRDGDCVKVRIPHGSRYRMEQMQVVSP